MPSVLSSIIAAPDRFIYTATKVGVIGLTKGIAADFITKGIRANYICPATIGSPSLHNRMARCGDNEAGRAVFIARQTISRVGTPEEIAALEIYLACDKSAFMTGQAITIDGGMANV